MTNNDTIAITAKVSGARVIAYVRKKRITYPMPISLSLTPSSAGMSSGEKRVFTLSGKMEDGTDIPDNILETAKWNIFNSSFSLDKTTGKSVTLYCQKKSQPGDPDYSLDSVENVQGTLGISSVFFPEICELNATITAIKPITAKAEIKLFSSGTYPYSSTMSNMDMSIYGEDENNSIQSYSAGSSIVYVPIDESITTYQYDDNGNLINTITTNSKGTKFVNYKYNALNQLTEYTGSNGTKTNYTYNIDGLRKTKTSEKSTTAYYYDGDNVIIETINGIPSARNIWGINAIARESNGKTLYFLYNGHADVVAMVDDSGNVVNTYDYDIYGSILKANETGMYNPIKYAGQYYDDESDMYYLRARYYDPELMRFISEDTNKGDVKNPLSLNLYTYCKGNRVPRVRHLKLTGESLVVIKR